MSQLFHPLCLVPSNSTLAFKKGGEKKEEKKTSPFRKKKPLWFQTVHWLSFSWEVPEVLGRLQTGWSHCWSWVLLIMSCGKTKKSLFSCALNGATKRKKKKWFCCRSNRLTAGFVCVCGGGGGGGGQTGKKNIWEFGKCKNLPTKTIKCFPLLVFFFHVYKN